MNKFWIVLSHTYFTRVKSKAFIITTLITLLVIFAAVNIQQIIDTFSSGEKDKIAVIDTTDQIFAPLKENAENIDDDLELVAVSSSESEVKEAVQDKEYEALVILSLNDEDLPEGTYYANNITNSGVQQVIEEQLQQLKVGIAIEHAGIDQEVIESIYDPVAFHAVALDKTAKTNEELNQARGIIYVMVILMYIVVIIYGTMIINAVATEKSSRVMELLISSAPPVTHMFAKIFGVALLGLTQIGILILAGYAMIALKKDELAGGMLETFGILNTPVSLIIYSIVFFLLGYILYATIAAMLGSLVSRSEDAQQLIMPLIFLIMIGYFIAIFGLAAPESTLVTVSSYIPFFSPMLMLLRIGMLDIPIWQVAISIGILIVTIVILALLGARVYRGGVLMYGKSNSLKDVKKAFQLSKKE
ncbi:ABC-2 type transport system permease protein [Virgibacillus halotolerans]|uniref:ABC transporter permease n=1 Tax=Virgibacillus halotolerans TaxID=1071053 RepID=UPI00195FDD6A|nr:ABC transporter permease [Virgibacillus halotolerans]MBM7601703.1 ABC-2 type transport system permease protein [Virgibacillus halotolerans]